MVSTELGACEWFVWDLRRSNLLDRGQLDQVVGEYFQKNPRAEPKALAEHLIACGALTPFQAERLLAGKTQGFVLGPFTLMDALGSGSMGTVYKAQSKTDNKWYAVKVLPRRSMWNVRIARRKVRAFEQVKHPSVVPFVDVGTAGGMHYLAWPFVEGKTLDKWIEEQGKLHPSQAAHYGAQIAEGLEACHAQQLIHGLLKPSNILIGADDQVYILDCGIGCLLAETEGESLVDTMSTANSVTSGLDCASPESIMDPTNLTPAGDQYSLGCVLYFMLTGQVPFPEGNAAEKMMAHQFKQPTPVMELNPETPAELAAVVDKLMRKAPEDRYGQAAEAAEAFKPLASDRRPAPRALSSREAKSGSRPSSGPLPRPRILGSAPSAPPRSVGPSTPTPTPASRGSLPGREAFAGGAARPRPKTMLAISQNQPQAPVEPTGGERIIPGAVDAQTEFSLEERLGPIGIVAATILACMAVFFLASWLGMFR